METIEFDDDEDDELPAPITLKDVQLLNKAGQQAEEFAVVANGEGPPEVRASPRCPTTMCLLVLVLAIVALMRSATSLCSLQPASSVALCPRGSSWSLHAASMPPAVRAVHVARHCLPCPA